MQRNDNSQNQIQKTVSAARPATVADIIQSQSAFRPSPAEVAKKAYFSYLNEGSKHGRDEKHWLEAEAQLFGGVERETQMHPGSSLFKAEH
jgi:hypothetical protein